jgi:hypothetical protein
MAISSDYPRPITVNGYVCRNCDDVSKAKKFEDPGAKTGDVAATADGAVSFGGSLAGRRKVGTLPDSQATRQALDRYA